MRPVGTPEQLEDRRRKAIALLQQGHRVNETARLVGVTPGAITQWRQAYDQQGEAFFEAHRPPGRACCLSEKQIDRLKKRLLKGARKNGYRTELWTLRRIAEVIEKYDGIVYDPSSVWHILKRMGWSCQKPEKQAREQDEEAIAGWRQKGWPRIKKSPQNA
jgi:transposase